MEFSNLRALAVLGTGGFSMVTLVRNTKVPDTFFALKAVSKKQVYEGKMTENIMVEKAALAAACTHPMCLQMIATFQDDNFLYLLTEVAEGGDLMKRMVAQDILPIDVALFYAGCITTAVAHMHEHHFIHRDIKPEVLSLGRAACTKCI
jgi:serine/threonine protein kinase